MQLSRVRLWIFGYSEVQVILSLPSAFSNKILIERDDSEKQHFPHYPDDHVGVDAN